MDEAEYCDRIAVIDHGKIVALGSPAELKKQVGGESIAIVSRHPGLKELVESAYGRPVTQDGDELDLRVDDAEAFMPRLLAGLEGIPIERIAIRRPTIEDVFLSLTGRTIRPDEASSRDRLRTRLKARGYH